MWAIRNEQLGIRNSECAMLDWSAVGFSAFHMRARRYRFKSVDLNVKLLGEEFH